MMDALLMASEAQRHMNQPWVLKLPYPDFSMRNALAPVAGPYESPTMNRKLAAAKQWLAEHY